jgi:hypothetical protein
MNIYVCGGSTELDLVAGYMARLRAMGHTITHDWVARIREVGEANPREATEKQRTRWSREDISGLEDASVVWLILPIVPSFGAAFEAGFALGSGTGHVIASGDWRSSIFTSQLHARFNHHDHALEWLRLRGTPGSWDDEMAALEAT